MKKELKEFGELLLLLILHIAMMPFEALILLVIARKYELSIITQFSFVQIIGIVLIIGLARMKHKSNQDYNDDKNKASLHGWKRLRDRFFAVMLILSLAYLFHGIFI